MTLASAAVAFILCASALGSPPTVVPCPGVDCLVPDVALDDAGVLHCVYGTSTKQALYQQSQDNGATWSRAYTLNDARNVTTTMGERGPKLAVAGGAVYVIWMDLWYPSARTYARLAVSRDGGKTFSAPVAASDDYGIDGVTVAADSAGGVLVAWHWADATDHPVNATSAAWLVTRASNDGGVTWAPSARAAFAPGGLTAPVACSMCAMRLRARGAPGSFALAFRSAVDNVREHWIVNATLSSGAAWAAERTADSWALDSCPMNGPELSGAADGGDSEVIAFMSGDANRVFWSSVRGDAVGPPVGTPAGAAASNERYPTAVALSGAVLMVWNVGPMAVSGTAVVHWALYDAATGAITESGSLGTSFAGTKATVWARQGKGFFVMTTAR